MHGVCQVTLASDKKTLSAGIYFHSAPRSEDLSATSKHDFKESTEHRLGAMVTAAVETVLQICWLKCSSKSVFSAPVTLRQLSSSKAHYHRVASPKAL